LPSDEECDPLATTLESARDYSPVSEPASTKRDGAWVRVEQAESVEEEDEDGDLDSDFFRDSCPPVVADLDLDLDLDEPSKVVMLTPAEASRRARLRRGVGIAVGTVGMLAVALSVKAAVTTAPAHAERHQAVAAALVVQPPAAKVEAPSAAKVEAALQSTQPKASDEASEQASFKDVARETLRLLNERDHEQAAAEAKKLIELEPDNAF